MDIILPQCRTHRQTHRPMRLKGSARKYVKIKWQTCERIYLNSINKHIKCNIRLSVDSIISIKNRFITPDTHTHTYIQGDRIKLTYPRIGHRSHRVIICDIFTQPYLYSASGGEMVARARSLTRSPSDRDIDCNIYLCIPSLVASLPLPLPTDSLIRSQPKQCQRLMHILTLASHSISTLKCQTAMHCCTQAQPATDNEVRSRKRRPIDF